jgi:hypothetical protein
MVLATKAEILGDLRPYLRFKCNDLNIYGDRQNLSARRGRCTLISVVFDNWLRPDSLNGISLARCGNNPLE